MWELTLFESGCEMDTRDVEGAPAVGFEFDGMRVVAVLEFDAEAMTATVSIEFV